MPLPHRSPSSGSREWRQRDPRGGAAERSGAAAGNTARIDCLLVAWQATGAAVHLERLVTVIRPLVHHRARATLHRLGIDDASACDDAFSLVLDHLRRLPGVTAGERAVAPFAPRRDDRCVCDLVDSGRRYISWLARERAVDVARGRRRRQQRLPLFSHLDRATADRLHGCPSHDHSAPSREELCDRLRQLIPRLPQRQRLVVELLLEGKNQAVIAHQLDVCDGTVSRLRARTIAALRALACATCTDP